MLCKLKVRFLRALSYLFRSVTVSTVNGVCWYNFGQEKEPETLKRFKKNNKN